ncbi:MAG: alpha/beta hydrolase [Metallosphaera yellowstonensis]|jgi:pimeloyl-ACP methyl ester carboxylesterase
MPHVVLEDVNLYFQRTGLGRAVVLIHHLAGSTRSWKYVYPVITDEYMTVTYDLRGHGLSSIPPHDYLIEDHVDDLKNLLDYLQVSDPILIGHSIGSLIAMGYALRYPVRGLVLLGAIYKAPDPMNYMKYVSIVANFGMEALAYYRRNMGEFSKLLTENPRAWNDLLEVYRMSNPRGYINTVMGLLKAKDYSELLSEIDTNTLVIYGSEDRLKQNKDIFLAGLRKADYHEIPGAGHFLNIEAPEQLLETMKPFIDHVSR